MVGISVVDSKKWDLTASEVEMLAIKLLSEEDTLNVSLNIKLEVDGMSDRCINEVDDKEIECNLLLKGIVVAMDEEEL